MRTAAKASRPAGRVFFHPTLVIGIHMSVRTYPDHPDAIDAILARFGLPLSQGDPGRGRCVVFSGGANFDASPNPLRASLEGNVNDRPSDYANAPNRLLGKVTIPESMPKDAFIEAMIHRTLEYNRRPVPYALVPGIGAGYNSNSYIRQLVSSAGGTIEAEVDWRSIGFNAPSRHPALPQLLFLAAFALRERLF